MKRDQKDCDYNSSKKMNERNFIKVCKILLSLEKPARKPQFSLVIQEQDAQ